MRLQKYMSKCGVASRRKSEEIILNGLVSVNNKIVEELGTTINPNKDIVRVNGKVLKLESKMIYIILNKPIGYVTSLADEKNRKVVTDLINDIDERIYPVGRLDIDTSGLLLLSNDGDLTYKITHPSNKVPKKYIAIVEGTPSKRELEQLKKGIIIDGTKTSEAKVQILRRYESDSFLEIIIHEGRNRQIKKMCESINHPVKKLKRVSIGDIELGGLQIGQWRYLNEEEIDYLKKL